MRMLFEPAQASDLDDLRDAAATATRSSFDGLLLTATPELPSALVAAAAVGSAAEDLLVAAEVTLGDRHPLEVAEEAAVVDLGLGGRLILVVRPHPEHPDAFDEALDILCRARSPRPFRWRGERWTIPADLPENTRRVSGPVRVTPSPFQPRLELWVAGPALRAACSRGLGVLADRDTPLPRLVDVAEELDANPACVGAPRARRMACTAPDALTTELLSSRAAVGQDWLVLQGDPAEAEKVGRYVRPRIQIGDLPFGLEDFWTRGGELPPSDDPDRPVRRR